MNAAWARDSSPHQLTSRCSPIAAMNDDGDEAELVDRRLAERHDDQRHRDPRRPTCAGRDASAPRRADAGEPRAWPRRRASSTAAASSTGTTITTADGCAGGRNERRPASRRRPAGGRSGATTCGRRRARRRGDGTASGATVGRLTSRPGRRSARPVGGVDRCRHRRADAVGLAERRRVDVERAWSWWCRRRR